MWPAFLFTFFHFGKFRDAVLIGAPEKILALGQILSMDFIRMAGRGDHAPAGTFRHVEIVLLRISVPIIIIVLPFCDEFLVAFLSPYAKSGEPSGLPLLFPSKTSKARLTCIIYEIKTCPHLSLLLDVECKDRQLLSVLLL